MENKISIRIELIRQIAIVTGHKPRDDVIFKMYLLNNIKNHLNQIKWRKNYDQMLGTSKIFNRQHKTVWL